MCITCERENTRVKGIEQILTWKIYGIITHDPSSHVNLPLGLPGQCDKSMHQQFIKWHKKKEKKKKDTPHIDT